MNHLLYIVTKEQSGDITFVSRNNFIDATEYEMTTDELLSKLFTFEDAMNLAHTINGDVREIEWQ